jgi:hypothetical protein
MSKIFIQIRQKIIFGFFSFILIFNLAIHNPGYGALVPPDEARAVADLWYAMEINSEYSKLTEPQKTFRLDGLDQHQMFYLIEPDILLDAPPGDLPIRAYVIQYQPSGFVIVSAEDRIHSIIGFSVTSDFRWDTPERNAMRYLLTRALNSWWEDLPNRRNAHPQWSYLRTWLNSIDNLRETTFQEEAGTIYVLWETAAWDQGWPYNTTVVTQNGNTTGIPTGCVATAMSIKLRYHAWPVTGSGSHSYTDNSGSVRYSHSVNFGAHTYNWANMPITSLTATNNDVADLMYHAGVSVDSNYEVGSTGAWDYQDPIVKNSMNSYFRYKGTGHIAAQNSSAHDQPAQTSIRGGLPVVCGSMDHAMVIDGYRNSPSPYFHMNYGWSGSNNGWYDLSSAIVESLPYSSPQNYIYVDDAWTGTESGALQEPYNTVSEGVAAVPSQGQLWIKAGSYTGVQNVPITITKAMTVKSYEGTATIGP